MQGHFFKAALTLSLLVLPVRLAVDVHSALSSHHVAVLAELFDRSSHLERSDWCEELGGRCKYGISD